MDAEFLQGKLLVSRFEFYALHIGFMLAVLLATVDQAIVASALKSICLDLGGYIYLPWIGSVYGLSMLPSLLLYDKIAPKLGMKWSFLIAVVIFQIGSAICSRAPTMEICIFGRAISGLGAGGLILLYTILPSKLVSIKDDMVLYIDTGSAFEGISGLLLFISAVVAPALGGLLSDQLSWRWCFYVEAILACAPFLLILRYLHVSSDDDMPKDDTQTGIDFIGVMLLFTSLTCLIVPLQLYEAKWSWESPQSLAMYMISFSLFVAFVWFELKLSRHPVVPRCLFDNSTVPALMVISFCIGASFVSALWNIALFFQLNFDENQMIAGAYIIPGFLGMIIGLSMSKRITLRFENYIPFFYIGPLVLAGGIVLLGFLDYHSSSTERILYLLAFGFGDGLLHVLRSWALKAASPPKLAFQYGLLGVACLLTGSALSITFTGFVLKTKFVNLVSDSIPIQQSIVYLQSHGMGTDPSEAFELLRGLQTLYQNATEMQTANQTALFGVAISDMVNAYNDAYRKSFFSLLIYPVIMLIAAPFVKLYPLDL
ncbi:hypothetical protein HDU98_004500 [Podochytrium sp. JEL0797]|nr:hypothetical protein HDU98_004500 [Podochytrium sp. JEL0797]